MLSCKIVHTCILKYLVRACEVNKSWICKLEAALKLVECECIISVEPMHYDRHSNLNHDKRAKENLKKDLDS